MLGREFDAPADAVEVDRAVLSEAAKGNGMHAQALGRLLCGEQVVSLHAAQYHRLRRV